jgi:hypothetical protein
VGPGGSLDAEFVLRGDVPAGAYHVICDAIIIRSVDVTFELIHRRGDSDTQLATWMQHFDPIGGGQFDAQAYELDVDTTIAIDQQEGDELVFRYSGANTTASMAFIPNGDGALANGRIPNITLPR